MNPTEKRKVIYLTILAILLFSLLYGLDKAKPPRFGIQLALSGGNRGMMILKHCEVNLNVVQNTKQVLK